MFVHLHVHSPYSFLDGAVSVRELVRAAASCGMGALALTDHNNVCAAPEFHKACEAAGIVPIQGVELTVLAPEPGRSSPGSPAPGGPAPGGPVPGRPSPGPPGEKARGCHMVLLARGPTGYSNICRILTRAHLSMPRRKPAARLEDLAELKEGIVFLSGCRKGPLASLILQGQRDRALELARLLRDRLGRDNLFVELQNTLLPGDARLCSLLAELAAEAGLATVATNDVHYARKEDFYLHDLLTCVRTLTTLDQVHPDRPLNAENYFKTGQEMAALFERHPAAVANAEAVARECEPAVRPGMGALFPSFPVERAAAALGAVTLGADTGHVAPAVDCRTPYELLERLTFQGAVQRYGRITPEIRSRLLHELSVIRALGYEEYFLVVWDIVRFAREQGIRHAGRGSAADSAVAYCLGLTSVDSIGRGLLFERFMSLERAQKPDIDIDFDAAARDRVLDYAYRTYGKDHAAMVCTYSTFGARSAVRDLGKAMGFGEEELDAVAKRFPYMMDGRDMDGAVKSLPELRESGIPFESRRWRLLLSACQRVAGFPRFLGTHLGGIILSRRPLTDLTPLQMAAKGVVVSQFDKDAAEDMGFVKLDLLCLRMLSAVDQAASDARVDYERIPHGDRATFEMLNAGETVGAFQLESAAQRALQTRLGADNIEDIVASVALIRPGPIEGNMVEPFIARRTGREPVTYLHPKLEPILRKTYGVVLFQEQLIEIARAVAGFTPGEADHLRRAMSRRRERDELVELGREFMRRAQEHSGMTEEAARLVYSYIEGYAGFGFCEAHAAAFADTAYKTAYLARHYPAEFYAAILSNEPMGFYPARTVCLEAKRRGVAILPPDVNKSSGRFTVEAAPGGAARSGGARDGADAAAAGKPGDRRPGGDGKAIRIGLKQVKGMTELSLKAILGARPFASVADLCERAGAMGLEWDVAENLALCGALESICPNRRLALWEVGRAFGHPTVRRPTLRGPNPPRAAAQAQPRSQPLPSKPILCQPLLSPSAGGGAVPWPERRQPFDIEDFTWEEKLKLDYAILGMSAGGHLMETLRPRLSGRGVVSSAELNRRRPGGRVRVAGIVVRPHRPPTRSGRMVVFLALEDEFGLVDITVFEDVYQRCGGPIFTQPALVVMGTLVRRGRGLSVTAQDMWPLAAWLAGS